MVIAGIQADRVTLVTLVLEQAAIAATQEIPQVVILDTAETVLQVTLDALVIAVTQVAGFLDTQAIQEIRPLVTLDSAVILPRVIQDIVE